MLWKGAVALKNSWNGPSSWLCIPPGLGPYRGLGEGAVNFGMGGCPQHRGEVMFDSCLGHFLGFLVHLVYAKKANYCEIRITIVRLED